MHIATRAPSALLALALGLCAGGCVASLGPAAPAPPAAPYDPTWTTPAAPEVARLTRRSEAAARGEAWALASPPSDPAGIDTDLEPGLDLATEGPLEVYPTMWNTYVLGGGLHTGEPGVDFWENRLRVSFEKPTDYHGRYAANVQYGLTKYFFSQPNSFVAGTHRPWDLVHSVQLGANAFQPVHEKWALVLTGTVSWSAAEGASLGDGMSWSVSGGVGHRFSDELDIGAGVAVSDRFNEEIFIIGGPQFDWHPTEEFSIALSGAQLEAAYRPNDEWEWGIVGGFSASRFRLRDQAPQQGRIVTDTRLPIYLRLRWRGSKKVDVELRAGADVLRQFDIEDSQGRNGVAYDADAAPFFGLRWIQRL